MIGPAIVVISRLADINDWLYEKTVQVGDVWTVWLIGQPRLVVSTRPEDIRHVLKDKFANYEKGPEFHHRFVELLGDGIFNADGESWSKQRTTASHLFKRSTFRDTMAAVFIEHTTKFLNVLSAHADEGRPIDLHAYFHKITLDSIGEIGFGVNLDSVSSDENQFAAAFDGSQEAVNYRFLTPLWRVRKLFHPQEWRFNNSIRFLDQFTYKIVDERLNDPDSCATNSDLLSLFIQHGIKENNLPSRKFLRDLVINFIIAGRDTTAQALSWMFYELMLHPEELSKVVAEIDRVLKGRAPDFDSVKDLTYLTATFSETLRLHPSVPKDTKMCIQDDVLPSGHQISRGAWFLYSPYGMVFLFSPDGCSFPSDISLSSLLSDCCCFFSLTVMGRLPSLWGKDCLAFKPQRFVEDPTPSQFKFTAFQAGPRICLGKDMAYLEAKIVASLLLQHFEFKAAPNQPQVTYVPSLTLQMRNGLWCTATRRAHSSK